MKIVSNEKVQPLIRFKDLEVGIPFKVVGKDNLYLKVVSSLDTVNCVDLKNDCTQFITPTSSVAIVKCKIVIEQ